jgi:hypothetical protein
MKKALVCAVLAFLLSPAAASAGFGIGAAYELHPFFLSSGFDYKIDPKHGSTQEDSEDLKSLMWHSVYLGLGSNYTYGFVDFLMGYERLEGEIDGRHDDTPFFWDYGAIGLHGGGLVPLLDYLRLQIAIQATLGFGQWTVEDMDIVSDFAWGGTVGFDAEARFYPGGKAGSGGPASGFFVGAGLGLKYIYRQAFDSEGVIDTGDYRMDGWTLGFTILHIGFAK